MLDTYSGATRVLFIVGDPIAQVKAPRHFTAALRERGRDAVVVPAHVRAGELPAWMAGVTAMANCDGIIFTLPHKFAALSYAAAATPRARAIGGANVLRRQPDGSWWGDHFDGEGYVAALRDKGADPAGRRVLLVGAGGAASAIARAIADAGAARLAILNRDAGRRQRLLDKLADAPCACAADGPDPRGYDIVVNASACGMQDSDPLPVLAQHLLASQVVGDVITQPEVTPLLAAARAAGCTTVTGADMFRGVSRFMIDFFTASP